MGRAGLELVRQNHTPEGHYQKLVSLYKGLIDSKAKRIAQKDSIAWKLLPMELPWRCVSCAE